MLTNDKNVLGLVKKYKPAGSNLFNKRVIDVESGERIQLTGLNWSGGYKNEYVVVDLVSGESVGIPEPAWNEKYRERFVTLREGIALICYAFCGTGGHITLYVHPQNLTPLLEKPVELTENEKVVLYCTSCYKNSYGGEKDMRRKEANRMGYKLTAAEWIALQKGLCQRGLLTANGALTMAGRNACPNNVEHKLPDYITHNLTTSWEIA